MKKILLTLSILALTLTCSVASFGQSQGQAPQAARAAGKYYASAYAKWAVRTVSSTAAGAGAISVDIGLPSSDSLNSASSSTAFFVNPFQNSFPKGGGFVPVLVDAGSTTISGGVQTTNAETVTPTGTAGCNSTYPTAVPGSCVITGTFANAHGAGALIVSGSFGLQEAVNDAAANGGGVVVIDQGWPGTNTTVLAVSLPSSVTIEDDRNNPIEYFRSEPSALSSLATPAVPTLSNATTGGTWTAGAVFGKTEYVDQMGGLSIASADTTDSTTTTTATSTVSIASPVASTGAVGWIPCLSAVGGGAGSEICYRNLTSANCALTALETAFPACAIGANFTSLAPSTLLDLPQTLATGHTTFAPIAAQALQPIGAIQNTYTFPAVATVTSTAATIAQVFVPVTPGINYLSKQIDFCFTVVGTEAATAVPTFTLLAANQYAQSPSTLATYAFTTVTGAQAWTGCPSIQIAATGSSGTAWVSGAVQQAPAAGGAVAQTTAPAESTAVAVGNLTQGIWIYLNLASATANTTAVTATVAVRTPAS